MSAAVVYLSHDKYPCPAQTQRSVSLLPATWKEHQKEEIRQDWQIRNARMPQQPSTAVDLATPEATWPSTRFWNRYGARAARGTPHFGIHSRLRDRQEDRPVTTKPTRCTAAFCTSHMQDRSGVQRPKLELLCQDVTRQMRHSCPTWARQCKVVLQAMTCPGQQYASDIDRANPHLKVAFRVQITLVSVQSVPFRLCCLAWA